MYALIEKHDRTSSRFHDGKYKLINIVENYLIDFIINVEFIEIDSNILTKFKFVKRHKITILNQMKIEDENILKLIMKNNIKKIFLKLKLINQLKIVVLMSRLSSINVDLTTINLKSIKKHYKTLILFNSTSIAARFSKTISFNLNLFYYIT